MKPLKLLIVSIVLAVAGTFCISQMTGCATPVNERVTQVKTLASLGVVVNGGLDASAELLKAGKISVADWEKISAFYTNRWQPAYRFAVLAVKSDVSSIASPDLVALATEFSNLVASYQK